MPMSDNHDVTALATVSIPCKLRAWLLCTHLIFVTALNPLVPFLQMTTGKMSTISYSALSVKNLPGPICILPAGLQLCDSAQPLRPHI